MAQARARFWAYPPISWIAYPPLLVVLAAVLAVVLGAGAALGAPSIVWHDQPLTQVAAGLAIAVLCAHLGMVGYLLDSRENDERPVAPEDATVGSVARYVAWPLALLVVIVALGALLQPKTRFHGGLVLVGPVLVGAVDLWLAYGPLRGWALIRLLPPPLREPALLSVEWLSRRSRAPKPVERAHMGIHAVEATFVYGVAIAYFVAWRIEGVVTAAIALCFALALLIGVWGFFRYWFRRFRFFWTTAAFLAPLLLGVLLYDASVTGLAHVTFPRPGVSPRPLLRDDDAFAAWRKHLREPNPPLVVVATSGGALRAAVWTINVLASLEQHHPGFLRHVRIITGASGGMVGAAHLVSGLAERGGDDAAIPAPWFDRVIEDAAKDSLTAITRALIFPHQDRGTALERSWERDTNGRLARPFRELLGGERAGWLPSLVYSPMMVEDGRRLLVSNLQLGAIATSLRPWTVPETPTGPSISSLQLFDCAGDGIDAVKLSTIARLNATFPWVTSAALLTTDPDRRIVDAGYYDNYGVDIGTAWIRQNAPWLQKNTSGVLLLQIRDGTSHESELTAVPGPGPVIKRISGLSTPIEAFLHAREASMSFRNDQKVEALAAEFGSDPRCAHTSRFFATEVFDFTGEAPLQWYLSRAAIDGLKASPNVQLIDAVESWWTARVAAVGPPYWGPCQDDADER